YHNSIYCTFYVLLFTRRVDISLLRGVGCSLTVNPVGSEQSRHPELSSRAIHYGVVVCWSFYGSVPKDQNMSAGSFALLLVVQLVSRRCVQTRLPGKRSL